MDWGPILAGVKVTPGQRSTAGFLRRMKVLNQSLTVLSYVDLSLGLVVFLVFQFCCFATLQYSYRVMNNY